MGISKPYKWHHFFLFVCVIHLFLFHRSPEEFHLEQIWLSFPGLVFQVLEKRNVLTALQVLTLNLIFDQQGPVSS